MLRGKNQDPISTRQSVRPRVALLKKALLSIRPQELLGAQLCAERPEAGPGSTCHNNDAGFLFYTPHIGHAPLFASNYFILARVATRGKERVLRRSHTPEANGIMAPRAGLEPATP